MVVLIANLLVIIASLGTPYLTAYFIDNVLVPKNKDLLYNSLLMIFACYFLGKTSSYFSNIYSVKLHYKATFSLNLDVISHIQKLPLQYFERLDTVYLNRRVNDDAQDVIEFMLDNIVNVFVNIITVLGLAFILHQYAIELVYLLAAVAVVFILIYKTLKQRLYERSYRQKEAQNSFFARLNEQFSNIKFIKINALAPSLRNDIVMAFGELLNAVVRFAKANWLFLSAGDIVKYAATLSVLFIGGVKVLDGSLSIGKFVVINSYFVMAFDSIVYFLGVGKSWQSVIVSLDRINKIMLEPREPCGSTRLSHIECIDVSNVSFSYDGSRNVLSNFNCRFRKGNIYCILGNNGAGKSTLTHLLVALFNPEGGNIRYDNVPVCDIDVYHLRRHIVAFSEQEPTLFNSTIKKNLIIDDDTQNEDKLIYWLNRLNLKNLIDTFPSGLNTIIDRGTNISGGEKQKLSQARTFIKDAQVVILDEPTSSLDNDSVLRLQQILLDIKSDKIIIVITHHEKFQCIADEVIRL